MNTKVVILVDDKQKMLESLQAGLNDAEQYAGLCRQVLIDDYGADPDGIEQDGLIEGCFGHLIDCVTKGKPLTPPAEFVSTRLSQYSNHGLKKCGLTRAQYEKALSP